MIGTRSILAYTFLPQIRPRITKFLSVGFSNLATFMAQAYRGVKLLPENHPYLQPGMTGKYGVLDVLREASSNLTFSVKHIDQIIVFFALLAGMAILTVQFLLLLVSLMIGSASAGGLPAGIGEFFVIDNRGQDIALRMLDAVFGVPDIFGTDQPTGTTFHIALQQLFQFYSIGLLVIGALILAYYIFAVVAEAAQTGTPFGRRYNHAWAPVRLVVAIGLLIPIGSGLNAAQWLTLYSAKYGSGFATNAWIQFNETMADSLIEGDELIGVPNPPDLTDTVAFMHMVHACKRAYDIAAGIDIQGWIVDPENVQPAINITGASPFANGFITSQRKIHIRFGENDPKYTKSTSNVYPFCGEIVVTNNSPTPMGGGNNGNPQPGLGGGGGGNNINAIQIITWAYFTLINTHWDGGLGANLEATARRFANPRMGITTVKDDPEEGYKDDRTQAALEPIIASIAFTANELKAQFEIDENIENYGWGGAGIWYNQIANANGLFTNAIMNKPVVSMYPSVMEDTCAKNKQENIQTSQTECFDPRLPRGHEINYTTEKDREIAAVMSDLFDYWYKDIDTVSGNIFIDVVNAVMGTQGLFDMCRNADIHPLAQISATGKGLVEAAIRNLGLAFGTGAAGLLEGYFGPSLQAASSFFISVASVGILIGFILYYVIPFMPFLYFFFAVGGWVKGLFEAMVGVPLWALAHLRIDGQGLAGDAAINGYFLIFEIFIRPILIIFGLLASVIIFAAMVKVLNETFSLVVSNLAGFSTANESQCGTAFEGSAGAPTGSIDYLRGPIDEFFFTIVYAILVYMIGMASFKLIDLIPNQILRWMGAGVSTFNDNASEPAEGIVQKLAVGGGLMGSQLQQAGQAGAQTVGGFGSLASKFVKGSQ